MNESKPKPDEHSAKVHVASARRRIDALREDASLLRSDYRTLARLCIGANAGAIAISFASLGTAWGVPSVAQAIGDNLPLFAWGLVLAGFAQFGETRVLLDEMKTAVEEITRDVEEAERYALIDSDEPSVRQPRRSVWSKLRKALRSLVDFAFVLTIPLSFFLFARGLFNMIEAVQALPATP